MTDETSPKKGTQESRPATPRSEPVGVKAQVIPPAAIKGTRDILPEEAGTWRAVESAARTTFELYGYRELRAPVIEPTELFEKGTGQTSDIVTKEMYTFQDRSDRSLTLRPEGTPGVVRALLEDNLRVPCRLYYIGPMFRYNRPQKGRYREFYQLGLESFGEASPEADAEVIAVGYEYFQALGIEDCATQINGVGYGNAGRPITRS